MTGRLKRSPLPRGKGPRRRARVRKVNRARLKKLRAQQFGIDGYRETVLSIPCLVRGTLPVDPAHVLGTRGAGAGPEGLAPLSREIHDAFDSSMTDERLLAVHGFTREPIREWARRHRAQWERRGR